MSVSTLGELVKIQSKGLLTIPKKFRDQLGFEDESLAWVREEKGRLVIELARILPYPVRRYSDKDLKEFFRLDDQETKRLKKKGLI